MYMVIILTALAHSDGQKIPQWKVGQTINPFISISRVCKGNIAPSWGKSSGSVEMELIQQNAKTNDGILKSETVQVEVFLP